MQYLESPTRAACTGRLLRPVDQLRRLRAVRLGVVKMSVREWARNARAFALLERFAPEELREWGPDEGWVRVLQSLLRIAELEQWFVPDWPTLDWFYDWFMQVGYSESDEDEEPGGLEAMAEFLEYIPARRYNFSEEDWLNRVQEEYPVLAVVRGLVDPTYNELGRIKMLIDYEICDGWTEADMEAIAFRIGPETAEKPLCWLNDVVDFCRMRTGNPLLDTTFDVIDWQFGPWRWDDAEDVRAVHILSERAAPVWERIEAFVAWAGEDEERVERVVKVMMGVE